MERSHIESSFNILRGNNIYKCILIYTQNTVLNKRQLFRSYDGINHLDLISCVTAFTVKNSA